MMISDLFYKYLDLDLLDRSLYKKEKREFGYILHSSLRVLIFSCCCFLAPCANVAGKLIYCTYIVS